MIPGPGSAPYRFRHRSRDLSEENEPSFRRHDAGLDLHCRPSYGRRNPEKTPTKPVPSSPISKNNSRNDFAQGGYGTRPGATHRRDLNGTLASHRETVKVALVHLDATDQSERVIDAIRAAGDETREEVRETQEDEAMTRRALDLLGSRHNDRYEAALATLRADTREWWADLLAREPDELEEREEPATADEAGLRRFIEGKVMPWFETRRKELANRPLIREQAR